MAHRRSLGDLQEESDFTDEDNLARAEYKAAMLKGEPVYLLNPHNFKALGQYFQWDVTFTSTVLKLRVRVKAISARYRSYKSSTEL